jgi:hypothetical protein
MRPSKINARHDFRQAVRACLVCWDLLVSFYFYNGRHNMRCNGRILCARVAPALGSVSSTPTWTTMKVLGFALYHGWPRQRNAYHQNFKPARSHLVANTARTVWRQPPSGVRRNKTGAPPCTALSCFAGGSVPYVEPAPTELLHMIPPSFP